MHVQVFTSFVVVCFFFFFNDTATTEIYTLSLHDALPISRKLPRRACGTSRFPDGSPVRAVRIPDRKSTRLNSSHTVISYAVFCLKKKTRVRRTVRSGRLLGHHDVTERVSVGDEGIDRTVN